MCVVCVCVCTVCVNICYQVGKFWKKNHLYGIKHFQSNGASPIFFLLNLDFHVQSPFWHFIRFATILEVVRDRANITIAI